MDKQTFLDKVKSGRSQWDNLLSLIPRERMTQPGPAGEWSVKDIIAHISWHEQQMVGILQAHAFVGSDLWNLQQDQRNAAIYEQNRPSISIRGRGLAGRDSPPQGRSLSLP